jgi:SAM-dependent MidA family methyltransferase
MITFRDFMETSLYDPKEGFYARRTAKADFYTAPELHPAFAKALANSICARLSLIAEKKPKAPLFIMEMGSGNGTLARQVISAIKEKAPLWISRTRFVLVERVETLLMDSILSLQDTGMKLLGYTNLEEIPAFSGVVYSNELFDAMPVHVLEKKDGLIRELYVRKGGRTELGLLSRRALVHSARSIRQTLQEGERHAVNLDARRWITRLGQILKSGSVITIDYGKRFAPDAPNAPRTYFKHTTGTDITRRPGKQDLTANVDFEQLLEDGRNAGFDKNKFQTMTQFLLDHGIMDSMPAGSSMTEYKERAKIKTLFHPDGMGERFKVLIQEKGI